jgi:hypothetical protein
MFHVITTVNLTSLLRSKWPLAISQLHKLYIMNGQESIEAHFLGMFRQTR